MTDAATCYHCGLPIAQGDHYSVTILQQPRAMCCPGCQSVAQTIVDIGMESYYQHRQQCDPGNSPATELVPGFLEGLNSWDDQALQQSFVHELPQGSKEITLLISGITCAACVWLIEKQVNHLAGVVRCNVNMGSHLAVVQWNPEQTTLSAIIKAIARIGYKAEPYTPLQQEQNIKQENKQALMRIGVAGLGAMQVMTYAVSLYMGAFEGIEPAHEQFLRWVSALVTTPVFFYSGMPFLSGALRSLRNAHLSMDVPVAVALCFAYFSSVWATLSQGPEVYFDSVCMFVFFLLVGRYLEMRARHRSQSTSIRLSHSQMQTARLLDQEQHTRLIPADQLKPGDIVLVKAGEVIPGDGRILAGDSAVNEAMLTGEQLPLSKTRDDGVTGGTLNVEQPLTIEISTHPKDSTLSTLRRLLERAEAEKPPTFVLADTIASRFVFAVLLTSVCVYTYWWFNAPQDAFWIMLSVLVVTCPCALSLATPTAITAATARLSQMGFLATRAHTIEGMRRVTDVVFDKTGTLTMGEFVLAQTIPLANLNAEQVCAMASALESVSEHPIARAFHGLPAAAGIAHQRIVANQGLEGKQGNHTMRIGKPQFAVPDQIPPPCPGQSGQWILLSRDGEALAWFRIEDQLRPDAERLLQRLQNNGLRCHILSGDSSGHAEAVARQLQVSSVVSNAAPQAKLDFIRRLQQSGACVLMLGDGLNDAPVLAGADVSIAVAGSTDLAKLAADGILLGNSLWPLTDVLQLVNKTYRIIRQNLGWAILYNLTALPLAAAGYIPPWASALGMSASSLLVVVNALRLNSNTRQQGGPH
ncbi:MAG: cbb3-type cytochrome oxidase assembly protein CcoS [Pseudomonadales bacterium]|jgi:P-type Cu2+ transporter|nr:cbb3-type cytochrome oxidase assembly protein CcoS [Pseudomonadales bacterium]MBI26624.1 cbb3-type cytochrome oxidase assembly protein CcoS [Pseudomonadales bacterium]MEC8810764.1 heavy metal translocating P-type ATPase [Pseudomonadota bacterium]TNC90725.1 MAG: cbb3-type cytochrome oxidase assembly protein CcoS [Alcanivorax sp.]HAU16216.1 cadmium-translocating P-type ATPase [Gammaproteobacteria bacterium]|tara:strand:+ start:11738 stop:14173 length:2436 start_codon:yes stop_codon:yes gene_type:complete